MKLHLKIALVTGALVLAAVPGTASAGPDYKPAPEPKPSPPPHAKAYGHYCQGKSKKHVKGEQGTEFSRCVKAMAKARNNDDATPREACKGLSKKHVKGEKGTEFSRCVKTAAKLRKDREEDETV
jgi:hypothetical protein